MRYLGNKESIAPFIREAFEEKDLLNKNFVLFDAFAGTGSVSVELQEGFRKIIINDNLKWASYYSKSRILSSSFEWKKIGQDPIDFLNKESKLTKGFIYQNYAPSSSGRMYFSDYNAQRLDYFRITIQEWFEAELISSSEFEYLISCVIEAMSKVANIAGVYGAFLKKWDSRALKPILLSHLPQKKGKIPSEVENYNSPIEDIISDVECDVLYLDPPYTQNQYGTQYHLPETITLYDSPSVSKVTGSRPTGPMRSDWSKDLKVHILLDSLLSKTRATHIFLSYSSDGLMSKDFIESVFKRYGKRDTYKLFKIPYKYYQNWKSKKKEGHEEYLFYIELKNKSLVRYQSPLNYTGNKFNMIDSLLERFPSQIDDFYDIFGGGMNVGINVSCEKLVYNDINPFVVNLLKSFRDIDTYEYLKFIKKNIRNYGLEKGNSESYLNLRQIYNDTPHNKRDPKILFLLIMYGFNQQIRFNSKFDFNNPSGIRWFNEKMLEKFISFSRRIKEIDVTFCAMDYEICLSEFSLNPNDFIYADPPYLLTTGSYNDGRRGFKGWNALAQTTLLENLCKIDQIGLRWMLSYISTHREMSNELFAQWMNQTSYVSEELQGVRGHGGSKRNEMIVYNYDPEQTSNNHK